MMENRPIVGDDVTLYNWLDITDSFRNACKELSLGELQHDSSFSLFEGMSAIELMDPKMDAGMIHRNSANLGFDNAVNTGNLKLANVSYSDLLVTMDATFASIVALYEGHSLAQAIFTNLYLHKPHLIEDRILKAFSLCVLKLVYVSYDIIRRANVCEEEDFQQMLYNFDLAGDVTESRVIGMVKEAEDDCQKIIRNAKGKLNDEMKFKIEQCDGVLERLRFIRHFLVALISLTVREEKNLGQSTQHGGALPKSQNIDEAKRNLQNCEESIAKMAATSILNGILPEDDYNYKSVSCIEPHVNQRLLPPTFPRHTKFLRPPEVFDYLNKFVQRLTLVCSLSDHVSTFGTVLDFFRDFSRRENCVMTRSVLQLTLMPQGKGVLNKIPFVDLVKEAIREFIQPPVLNPKYTLLQDAQCKGLLDDFLKNCCRVLAELLRVCGHNRARQRDYYAVVLEELGNLQEEADRLDAHLHSVLNHGAVVTAPGRHHLACLGSFVLYHVLKAMIEYLLLGFELELYSVHEYAYIYWYTNEFLFKWLVNVLHKADNFVYEQEQFQNKQEKIKGDKKKNRSKKKPTKSHRFEIMQLQSKQKLCEGYYRAMLGFYAANRIRTPTFANSDENDAIRYEHRLAPFAHMATPPMIGYHQYLEISNLKEIILKIPSSRLFMDAAHCFEEARMGFENIPPIDEQENNSLVKITKMNTVVLKLLASGHSDGSTDWPRFDFSFHRNFPVLKLK